MDETEIEAMIAIATAGSVSERQTFLCDNGPNFVKRSDILDKITMAFTQAVHYTPQLAQIFKSSVEKDHVCERYLRRRPANFSVKTIQPSSSVVNNCHFMQLRVVVFKLNGAPSREPCWCGSKKASNMCHKEHFCVQVILWVCRCVAVWH